MLKTRRVESWPFTSAWVTESEQFSVTRQGDWNRMSFTYQDDHGKIQSGMIAVDSFSSMYSLAKGGSFPLQYDPENPERFYCSDAQSLTRSIGAILGPLSWSLALVVIVGTLLETFFAKK